MARIFQCHEWFFIVVSFETFYKILLHEKWNTHRLMICIQLCKFAVLWYFVELATEIRCLDNNLHYYFAILYRDIKISNETDRHAFPNALTNFISSSWPWHTLFLQDRWSKYFIQFDSLTLKHLELLDCKWLLEGKIIQQLLQLLGYLPNIS